MWCPDRHLIRVLLLAGLCGAAGGCGFRPLYGANDGAAQTRLAAIDVRPIADRSGQQLRGFLLERLGSDERAKAAYALEVKLAERRQELGIRADATPTRVMLTMTADYVLRDAGSGQEIVRGRSRISNAFNILQNEFSNIMAEADARQRALRELSDDIRTELAVELGRRS